MTQQRFLRLLPLPTDAETAFQWHARPGAFDRLVPPWRAIRVIEKRGTIENGDALVFRAGIGPVGMRWHAVHEDYEAGRQFVDVQVKGPFAHWRHVHRFETVEGRAHLIDDIAYALPGGALGQRLGGRLAERDLAQMFAYRHATTAADLALHARYEDEPRLRIAICHAGHPLLATVCAMLTTGGHTVTSVPWPDRASDAERAAASERVRVAVPDVVITLAMKAEEIDPRLDAVLTERPWTLVSFQRYHHDHNQCSADGESSLDEDNRPAGSRSRSVVLRAGDILGPGGCLYDRSVSRARLGLMMTLSNDTEHAWISRDDAAAAIVHAVCDPTVAGTHAVVARGRITPRQLARAAWEATWGGDRAAARNRTPARDGVAGFPARRHPDLSSTLRYLLGRDTVVNQAPAGPVGREAGEGGST